MMTVLHIAIWILGATLSSTELVNTGSIPCACTCVVGSGDNPPAEINVEKLINKYDALFFGKVVLGRVLEPTPGVLGVYHEFTILVEEQWAGESADSIAVRTGKGGGDCGYKFELGQYYLVQAYKADPVVTPQYGDHLYTGICTITGDLREKETQELLEVLRR